MIVFKHRYYFIGILNIDTTFIIFNIDSFYRVVSIVTYGLIYKPFAKTSAITLLEALSVQLTMYAATYMVVFRLCVFNC